MIALTRILVPTNLGEPSKAAVRYAVAFAKQFDAQLFVLHVLRARDLDAVIEAERVVEALGGDRDTEPEPDEVTRNAAHASLRQLLDSQEGQDTRVEYLLRAAGSGGPPAAIAACAREKGVQLIIMGKHRMGLVEHMLAGSVTEKVVRQAPCPVMIVQYPEQDFVLPDTPAVGSVD